MANFYYYSAFIITQTLIYKLYLFLFLAISPQVLPDAIPTTGIGNTNSIVIKILPSNMTAPILPLGVLTKESSSNVTDENKELTKSKNLRKIIPKIVIDKC